MLAKVTIEKTTTKSRIVGDNIQIYMDPKEVDGYCKLVKRTWPNTILNKRLK